MTGWRIGYAAGPVPLIRAMGKIQSQSTSNPCSISQWAAVEALTGPQDFLEPNRRAVPAAPRPRGVDAEPGARASRCPRPEGAFYVYPDISGCIGKTSRGRHAASTRDEDFATALLDETGVAVVFGAAFGLSPALPGQLRHLARTQLTEACSRIQDFCAGLR